MAQSVATNSDTARALKAAVSIRAAAEADLREARDWYEERRHGLGDEFLASVANALVRGNSGTISNLLPGISEGIYKEVPIQGLFRVEGELVIVFRILHAARDHLREL